MGSPYFTSLPQVLPNLAPISMTGNHGAGFTRAADTNLLYSPTTSLIPSVHPHHQMGPTTAPVNTHLHFGYPNANGSSAQDSTGYSGCPPLFPQPQTTLSAEQPLAINNMLMHTLVTSHKNDNIVYRKTRRPPAAYSPDVRIVAEGCRADGGEEHAIALLPRIFSIGVSEKALIRKMTREEAREHHTPASTQVYRMLLRNDSAGRFHCRLCAIGANQGGWKNAKDVLRHLKRDHFGLVIVCPKCGKSAYTTGEMSRHRCENAAAPLIAHD